MIETLQIAIEDCHNNIFSFLNEFNIVRLVFKIPNLVHVLFILISTLQTPVYSSVLSCGVYDELFARLQLLRNQVKQDDLALNSSTKENDDLSAASGGLADRIERLKLRTRAILIECIRELISAIQITEIRHQELADVERILNYRLCRSIIKMKQKNERNMFRLKSMLERYTNIQQRDNQEVLL
jgi:hypothetical protein